MADSKQVKEALAALADGDTVRDDREPAAAESVNKSSTRDRPRHKAGPDQASEYRTVIERAANATDDIEAAAAFVEGVGIGTLEIAVADAERELSGLAEDGREALAAFERFRAAADGSNGKRRHG